MVCPVCPVAGYLGGWLGGYFGINVPQDPARKILSAVVTASLITTSVIALKVIFNVSLCVGGEFTLENIVRVGGKTLVMGLIYSIGVNYILNRYLFSQPLKNQPHADINEFPVENSNSRPCCCKGKKATDS